MNILESLKYINMSILSKSKEPRRGSLLLWCKKLNENIMFNIGFF